MKPKINPNFPTTGVLILLLFAALFLLAIGIGSVSTVREGLTTGQIYSVGVIFNFTEKIPRSSSPVAYWIMVGLYSLACVGGIGLGITTSIFNIKAYIKKLERQKKEGSIRRDR